MYVAATQRHEKGEYDEYRDILECSYVRYFESHGFRLFPVSNASESTADILGLADGMLLTGGGEVDPSLYGKQGTDSYHVSRDRDDTERELVDAAIEQDIPVFGICRGMQAINVYFDGGLVDLKEEGMDHPPGEHHSVSVEDNALKDRVGDTVRVNSYHDQAVTKDTLSPALEMLATAGGIVEGLYHPSHKIAGVQWHPERDTEEEIDRRLTEMFKQGIMYWS